MFAIHLRAAVVNLSLSLPCARAPLRPEMMTLVRDGWNENENFANVPALERLGRQCCVRSIERWTNHRNTEPFNFVLFLFCFSPVNGVSVFFCFRHTQMSAKLNNFLFLSMYYIAFDSMEIKLCLFFCFSLAPARFSFYNYCLGRRWKWNRRKRSNRMLESNFDE